MNIEIPKEIIDGAIKFHGHLGPFLILGLKAGLYATKILGKNPFTMKVIVECEGRPPTSCIIDGIQYSTGCTYGKRNIEYIESKELSITFTLRDKKINMKLKEDILRYLKNLENNELEKEALKLIDKSIEELFEINQ